MDDHDIWKLEALASGQGRIDKARAITPQLPRYQAAGPNSNTYAHQLLLNTGFTDVYPPDGATGYNYNYNQGEYSDLPPGYIDRGDRGYPPPQNRR